MPPKGSRVLVDTNAIAAAHIYGCWKALSKYYKLETATFCVEEATRQDRYGKRLVDRDRAELEAEIVCHNVSDTDRAALAFTLQGRVDPDDGERDLLALTIKQKGDIWWLCGPDKATLRAMFYLNTADRMCALEELAQTAGLKTKGYEEQYTKKWLSEKRTQLQLGNQLI